MSGSLRVLHLTSEMGVQVRLQRYLQSNLNMGFTPVVLCRGRGKLQPINNATFWIPGAGRVSVNYYEQSSLMFYLSRLYAKPIISDVLGLRKIFEKFDCQVVHAHSPDTAYYSYRLGLPTIFDDWEFWLHFFDYCKPVDSNPLGERIKRTFEGAQAYDSSAMRWIINKRYRAIVKELICNIPTIVTNNEVEQTYRDLGASSIWVVPNVPLTFERDYALAVERKKSSIVTTCYVGNLTADEKMFLRNTSGVRQLWQKERLGDLFVFEGSNFLPHLEVLRKIRECHFNLLFWAPIEGHRYYLQNKAFLASVVGVPTIISSSLKATVNLLGEYALQVSSLAEIPSVIRNYDFSKHYPLNPAHLWEFYEPRIKAVYEFAVDNFS